MSIRSFALKPIALVALLGLAGAANATFVTYDSASAFAAATSTLTVGTDAFTDLAADAIASPLTRAAGSIGYTVSTAAGDLLYGLGGALSTNSGSDPLIFTAFSSPVFAIGGNFFNTDFGGDFAPGEALMLTIGDATGTHDFLYSNITSANSYFGIVSTTQITSLTVTGTSGDEGSFASVDNLQLAAAVPEPETYALMLGGLGVVAWLRRRQQKSAA